MEPEPQKNGKTINWCTVDVGDANGTGEPQGIVCGAHNFAPGDLVVVILPGGVLPGNFEISARKTYGHVSAGMICSARELGLGDDHDGIIVLPADAGEPGDDARDRCSASTRRSSSSRSTPTAPTRCRCAAIAREAALAYGAPYRDPAEREVPRAERRRLPGRDRRPGRLPGLRGPHGQRLRPGRADARTGWRSRLALAGHAPDLAGRRRHQLRDARARPADPRLRRRQAPGPDPGPPRHRGRAAHHPRRRRPRAVDRGPRRHRRLRDHRPRRRDGRRDHRDVGDHHPGAGRGRALGRGLDVPHRQAAQAHLRGRQAQRARRRPGDHPGRGRPGGRAARRTYGGGTAEPGVTVVGDAARAGRRSRWPPTCPARDHRHRRSPPTPPSPTSRPSAARSTRTAPLTVDPAAVATRPHRPLRPGRGGRPDRRLRPGAVGAPARGGRPRPDPRAAAAPPDRPHPRRRRLRRGDQLPVRRRGRLRRSSGCPPTTCSASTVRLANPLSTEEPSYTTTLLPGLLEAAARNLGRGAPGVALFETGTVAFPVDRGPAPIYGVDWRPSDDELAKLFEALPEQPLHLAVVLAGERERAGWWGAGRDGGLVRRDRAGPPARRRARRRGRGRPRRAGCRGTRAAAPSRARRTASSSATPASCTRRSAQAFGLPAAARPRRDRPRRPDGARASTWSPGPDVLDLPGRQGGRRPRGRRRRARGRGRGGAARGRGRAARVDPALRRLHRRPGRATGASRWRSRCGSGPPTAP